MRKRTNLIIFAILAAMVIFLPIYFFVIPENIQQSSKETDTENTLGNESKIVKRDVLSGTNWSYYNDDHTKLNGFYFREDGFMLPWQVFLTEYGVPDTGYFDDQDAFEYTISGNVITIRNMPDGESLTDFTYTFEINANILTLGYDGQTIDLFLMDTTPQEYFDSVFKPGP